MIDSEKSGIAFSVHPVTQDDNQILIEAGFGLGEAIVSGAITPDAYIVGKKDNNVDININEQTKALYRKSSGGNKWKELKERGKKQILSEKEILKLSEIIKKIENHYGTPQDIEWAQEACPNTKGGRDGKFYITQSRPITTLKAVNNNETKKKNNILKLIKNNKFHKQFVYSFIPVICFESANYCYINNPLKERLGINQFPNFVVILNNNYEDWGEDKIQKIKDKDKIQFIIDENRKIIKKYKSRITSLLKINYKKLNNKEISTILKDIDNVFVEIYYRYIYLIHDYLETENKELIKVLPEVRIEMSEFVDKIYKCCDYIITALAEKFSNVLWKTFTHATFDEIIYLLQNPETIDEFKKVYKRPIAFVFDNTKLSVIKERKDVLEIIDILNKKTGKVKNTDKIKGKTAFGGKVCGKIVKISEFDYEKIDKVLKVKKDYILVTPMTRPEFMPYLNNCSAIITDEGGITCHAAIVSRELGIPCIIGTKIATQVLQDGDLVEVDAEKGVVRILKKANER